MYKRTHSWVWAFFFSKVNLNPPAASGSFHSGAERGLVCSGSAESAVLLAWHDGEQTAAPVLSVCSVINEAGNDTLTMSALASLRASHQQPPAAEEAPMTPERSSIVLISKELKPRLVFFKLAPSILKVYFLHWMSVWSEVLVGSCFSAYLSIFFKSH